MTEKPVLFVFQDECSYEPMKRPTRMTTTLPNSETPTKLHALMAAHSEELLNCVHCGLCLPSCPTYQALGNENDSPRGRVYLMRGVVEGKLELGDTFTRHIDLCLGCRACETACPSGVPYGHLLEYARAEIVTSRGAANRLMAGLVRLVLQQIFTRPRWLAWSMKLAKWFRDSGLAELAFETALFGERLQFALAVLLSSRSPFATQARNQPQSDNASDGRYRAAGGDLRTTATSQNSRAIASKVSAPKVSASKVSAPKVSASGVSASRISASGISASKISASKVSASGAVASLRTALVTGAPSSDEESASRTRVGVLRGCVMEGLFSSTNRATERVLQRHHCELVAVKDQQCCGALHAHAGYLETAKTLARKNIKAFLDADCQAIIVNSAGCGAAMKEYKDWLADDDEYAAIAQIFSAKVKDVAEFLIERGLVKPAGAVNLLVTYDAPCHLLHAQRLAAPPVELLQAIPGLQYKVLPGAENCCGGAGLYNLQHPELSAEILSGKLEHIRSTGADLVATANPGCIMQIGAGAKLAKLKVAVVHPIELLDAAYEN
ncbi:MAG: 4Fe-4S dicluster domain-containing protein [Acidobacteria bacterium]|nr:4Fe-4S dicluster domain-containing protein [Acidobacteriota bacterium]